MEIRILLTEKVISDQNDRRDGQNNQLGKENMVKQVRSV